MYQTIDDDATDVSVDAEEAPRTRWWLMVPVVMAIGLFLFFVYGNETQKIDTAKIEALKAERVSYHSALTERSAALRRARLTDFITTYHASDRRHAVRTQLNVLDAKEAERWANVTETMFNADLSRDEKMATLDQYEKDWGSTLLGGRDTEITALREELSADLKKYPSRKLTEEKTSVSEDIDGTELVGGLHPIDPDDFPDDKYADLNDLDEIPGQKIVPPKLTKKSNPKYPRGAYRRGVGALVTVSLDIDAKGRVDDVEIVSVEASRYQKDFAKAARKAAKKSRYKPKTINGKAVPTKGHVKRYRFTPG